MLVNDVSAQADFVEALRRLEVVLYTLRERAKSKEYVSYAVCDEMAQCLQMLVSIQDCVTDK